MRPCQTTAADHPQSHSTRPHEFLKSLFYTFAFVIVDSLTTMAALVYAAAVRLVVRRDRMFHVHILCAIALALALIVRRDTLYYMEKRLVVVDALAVGVLALTIVVLVAWTLRTSERETGEPQRGATPGPE